jgi:cysteine desulfurase
VKPIYLDSHATTPVDPRVLDVMLPFFGEHFGNASSRNHPYGWKAAKAVEHAREQVAALIGGRFRDVVFTSGATEANNLAIKGAAAHAARDRRRVVTVATEHRAVLDPCRALERDGIDVKILGVNGDGLVNLEELEGEVNDRTFLVTVMAGNNEIGVLQPLEEISRIARSHGALFHCDAVQAAGIVSIDVKRVHFDMLSLSAHKMYGPKGVGALYVSKATPPVQLRPLLDGGGHERGYRSGTLNVPGIVGFGKAAELCAAERVNESARLASLRDSLLHGLQSLGGVHVNGSLEHRLPQNLNVRFDGVAGETLLASLASEVAISSGAACATVSAEPSHVLKALGLTDDQARASLRFGFHRFNTGQEVSLVVSMVCASVERLRNTS